MAKKCKQLLERGNPPLSRGQGARGFSFLHPGVVLYCILLLLTHNTMQILHFKSPKVISIYVLAPATWEQTAPELPLTQALSLQVLFPPLSLHGTAPPALPHKSFHYFCLTASTTDTRFCCCGYTRIHLSNRTWKCECIYHLIHLLCCYRLFLSALAHRA